MRNKLLLTLTLVAAATAAHAQPSAAKKELVAKIMKMQQPAVEAIARGLVEQPAVQLLGSAANALPSRVAKDRQDAVAKEIQSDVQKYVEEATPLVRDRALKLAPTTIGPLLEEKFTEDELKQIVAMLESPAFGKFQRISEDMQKVLIDKVVADSRGMIEPKLTALEQTVGKRLGVPGPAAAPARPASR